VGGCPKPVLQAFTDETGIKVKVLRQGRRPVRW